MEEVFEVADRITVLRDGRIVLTGNVTDPGMETVIEAIVGRKFERAMESAEEQTIEADRDPCWRIRVSTDSRERGSVGPRNVARPDRPTLRAAPATLSGVAFTPSLVKRL